MLDFHQNNSRILDRLTQAFVALQGYAVLGLPNEHGQLDPFGIEPQAAFDWPLLFIPELEILTRYFERVLIKSDGYHFKVLCLQDCLSNSQRRIAIEPNLIQSIGKSCSQYTGTMNGVKIPAVIRMIEVRDKIGESQYLKAWRARPIFRPQFDIAALALGLQDKKVAPSSFWSLVTQKPMRKILQVIDQEIPRPRPRTIPTPVGTTAQPIFSYALLAILLLIFFLECLLGNSDGFLSISPPSLIAFGGIFKPMMMEEGQWYRLFSAVFLHANGLHILLNGIALLFGGMLLEKLVGHAWFLTIFFISALAGSLFSFWLLDPQIVSVGASGAIMGILAASFVASFRIPAGQDGGMIRIRTMQWLIPSMLPMTTGEASLGKIDYGAHLGGALAGFILGGIVLALWSKQESLPRFKKFATLISALGILLMTAALGQAFVARSGLQQEVDLVKLLAGDEQFQKLQTLPVDQAETLIRELEKQFPRDPRTNYYSALIAIEQGKNLEAEQVLKKGLEETVILHKFFPNKILETEMRVLWTELLLARKAETEAKSTFKPLCSRKQELTGLDPQWVESICQAP